jgi:hypothetical protein
MNREDEYGGKKGSKRFKNEQRKLQFEKKD